MSDSTPAVASAWQHPTSYRFYLQLYPQDGTANLRRDVESYFKCRFMSMQGVDGGGVKNTYTEDYAEQNGLRLWTPKPDDIRFKENDVTIKLRFRSEECGDVIAARDAFYNYVAGEKLEWYDTFRKKYLQLCLIEAPTIEYEKLTGSQYCVMSYKFKNFGGKPYTSSQL